MKDEYLKAYYAALYKKQQELEDAAKKQQELSHIPLTNNQSKRQVGMKVKREDDEGDDDIDWEDAPVAGKCFLFCIQNITWLLFYDYENCSKSNV